MKGYPQYYYYYYYSYQRYNSTPITYKQANKININTNIKGAVIHKLIGYTKENLKMHTGVPYPLGE